MIIRPAQDTPEIKIVAENFQEAHYIFKLLQAVKEAKESIGGDRVRKMYAARDLLDEL